MNAQTESTPESFGQVMGVDKGGGYKRLQTLPCSCEETETCMESLVEPDWSGSLIRVGDYIGGVVLASGALDPDRHPAVCAATVLLTRASRNLRAVDLLARSGFDLESHAIARMVFEDRIDLAYVATNPDVLAREWCDRRMVRQVFYARDILRDDPTAQIGSEIVNANQRMVEEEQAAKRQCTKREWHLWSKVTRRERARAAGLEWVYDEEYEFLSDFSHSSGMSLQIHSTSDGAKGRVPTLVSNGAFAPFAARSAIEAALGLCSNAEGLGISVERSRAWNLVDPVLWNFDE